MEIELIYWIKKSDRGFQWEWDEHLKLNLSVRFSAKVPLLIEDTTNNNINKPNP